MLKLVGVAIHYKGYVVGTIEGLPHHLKCEIENDGFENPRIEELEDKIEELEETIEELEDKISSAISALD